MKYSVCAALLLCASITMPAATLTIPVAADTSLYEPAPNNNYGASEHISAGTTGAGQRTRALLRFDLSAIPAGAVVSSVTLNINVSFMPVGSSQTSYQAHRMLQSWTEGTKKSPDGFPAGSGAAATAGEPTWNHRAAPSTTWTVAGGLADAAAQPSSSALITDVGGYEFPSSQTLVSDVQGWLANPSSNFGWMLVAGSEIGQSARRFGSKESGAGATIDVTYTAAPELRVTNIQISNGNANLTWTGSRAPYRIERAGSVLGPWTLFPTTTELQGSAPLSGPTNFFRVAGDVP